MNKVQQAILKKSAEIEEDSGGAIKLTYHKEGCNLWWNLYRGGVLSKTMHTNEAHAFVLGWELCQIVSVL